MIRVIGGTHKGRRLKMVPDERVRPLPAKLKEALFNIFKDNIKDAAFLDGFAGTGSAGIEALSRGAQNVVFIDEFFPAIKILKDNLAKCGFEDRARVIHREFNRAVIQLAREGARFDLIFLDPPYKLLEVRNPLKVIHKRGVLRPGGRIVIRHYFKLEPDKRFFHLLRVVSLGDDRLSFFAQKSI